MTAGTPLAPKLRFPEFRDGPDWTKGRCRDIAKVLPGYGFPDKFQGNKKGQYPFYKVSDISQAIEKGQSYISEANNYIDSDVLEEIRGKPVPAGTIIFAKIGEAIRLNRRVVTTKPAVIDNNTAGIKAMKAKSSDEFLFYLWSNVSLIDHAGGVVPAVSKSALENIPLCYPGNPGEQKTIADCLGSLDCLIAAEGRKLKTLRQHKQGLMQQLFPRPGETAPRLRFSEFRDAGKWVEKELDDVSDVLMCKRIFASETNPNGGVPFYKIGTLGGVPDAFISKELFEEYKSKYNFPRTGEILITCSGTVGRCLIYDGSDAYFQDSNIVWIDNPTLEVSNEFLLSILSNVNWSALNSTTITRIYGPDLRGLAIKFPKNEREQKRIADCLGSLDVRLAAQVQKLDTLKQHKQGLLQQLFPGMEAE